MSERAALILLNGELGEPRAVRAAAARCRGVICADGGLRHAAAARVAPDFVVGDMDSLPKPLPKKLGGAIFYCDFDEDRSDFEKALELAAGLGCERAYVGGGLDGRLDHQLVNLALAEAAWPRLDVVFVGSAQARLLGPGRHRIPLRRGRLFTLLAAPRALASLSGARYPLSREELRPGSRGLGNRSTGETELELHEGRVWLIAPEGR